MPSILTVQNMYDSLKENKKDHKREMINDAKVTSIYALYAMTFP